MSYGYPIQTVTAGAGGLASISFTSIPQRFTDLVLVISARSTYSADRADILTLTINGSATGYAGIDLEGDGVGVNSYSQTQSQNIGQCTAATATANTFNNSMVYLPNYTSALNKVIATDFVNENNATNSRQFIVANLWSNTSAITSLSFAAANGTFVQYSTATLYGI